MLGVGSLAPCRYCWDPDRARLELLLPVSARLGPPPRPCDVSACLLASSSFSFCRFSRSCAETGPECGTSEVEADGAGGLGDSEKAEGCGVGADVLDLRTCTEDGLESLDGEEPLSRHKT